MPISTITPGIPLRSSESIQNATSASQRALLSREDFLKLLTTELTHQDPLEPISNQEFLGQLASLQTLESTAALTDGIGSLTRFQQMAAASNMIGKFVRGVTTEGETIVGQVDRILLDPENGIQIIVSGKSLPFDGIREVRGESGQDPVDLFLDQQGET